MEGQGQHQISVIPPPLQRCHNCCVIHFFCTFSIFETPMFFKGKTDELKIVKFYIQIYAQFLFFCHGLWCPQLHCNSLSEKKALNMSWVIWVASKEVLNWRIFSGAWASDFSRFETRFSSSSVSSSEPARSSFFCFNLALQAEEGSLSF